MLIVSNPPDAAALMANAVTSVDSDHPRLKASNALNTLEESVVDMTSDAEIPCSVDERTETAKKSSFVDDDHNTCDSDDDDIDPHDDEPSTALDMLWTWYFPLLFLWFRRSFFGTSNLIRSVLIGQCIRLLLTSATGNAETLPKWVMMVSDPHAWPPPALTVLAILTIVAFVVHPDGLTWFMLGKVRDALLSLLHSFASCWTVFIQDYGIITTTIALMTLAGIGCVLGILLSNALPKSKLCRNDIHSSNRRAQAAAQEKKKKKRKGGLKGKGGRLRTFRKIDPNLNLINEDSLSQALTTATMTAKVEEEISSNEEIASSSLEAVDNSKGSIETLTIPPPADIHNTTAVRQRMPSASTVDTDGSNDSISVLSTPSMISAVTAGSTGASDSGKTITSRSRKIRSSSSSSSTSGKQQRLQELKGTVSSDRRKVVTVDVAHMTPISLHQSIPEPTFAPLSDQHRSHDRSSRPSAQMGKPHPAGSGRFANLKEQDNRFDKRRRSSHRSNNSGQGKIILHGGCHANSSTDATQSSGSFFPPNSRGKQSFHGNSQHVSQAVPEVQMNDLSHHYSGSAVQHGSPYSLDFSQATWKKADLGAFIATVGIVGDNAAALIANVPDIDGLECLSDIQFQLFGVGAEKQSQLGYALEERHRRRRADRPHHHNTSSSPFDRTPNSNDEIHPPPGLSPIHDEPPTLFGGSPYRKDVPPPVILTQPCSTIHPTRFPSTHPFAYDVNQNFGTLDDEESRIEAELQELGGKMVGSVLDF